MTHFFDALYDDQLAAINGEQADVWVAYSGGLDSTVLLHSLVEYVRRNQTGWIVRAIHVNHGLAQDADAWQKHCENFAQSLGIEIQSSKVLVCADGEGIENAARESRYAVFRGFVRRGHYLLMAHHLDDQAETVLLRLMRGAGVKGLAGIPKERPLSADAQASGGTLIRPLLTTPRSTLEEYARALNLRWVDDPSNTQNHFDRNFIRNQVLPLLATRWPDANQQLAQSARLCRKALGSLSELAEDDWRSLEGRLEKASVSVSIARLKNLSENRQFYALSLGCEKLGLPPLNQQQFRDVQTQILAGETVSGSPCVHLNPQFAVTGFQGRLHFIETQVLEATNANTEMGNLTLSLEQPIYLNGWQLRLQPQGHLNSRSGSFTVSFRQGGERAHPSFRHRSQTLKKVLQEQSVEPWLRACVPLIADPQGLAAVADFWVEKSAWCENPEEGCSVVWQYQSDWYLSVKALFSGC